MLPKVEQEIASKEKQFAVHEKVDGKSQRQR